MTGGWPRITIVTPSYNQGQFLADTIRSVQAQGYPNLEYFVVDGGSTDNSVDVIRTYEGHIDYWVSERDRGQSHAINKGFARATGEYVSWLNSDDMLLPLALDHVGEYARRNENVDVILGGLLLGDAGGRIRSCHLPTPSSQWCIAREAMDLFQPSMFVRRSTLLRVGPLREDLHCRMDARLVTRLADLRATWGYVPVPVSFQRRHPDAKGGSPAWAARYEQERSLVRAEYPFPEWEIGLARLVRRIQRVCQGAYLRNRSATRAYRGRDVREVWEWR
jgi:glycosyltransferase involved in cell wall biosynthesis